VTSSATGEGLEALAGAMYRHIPATPIAPAPPQAADLAEHRVFRPAQRGFTVQRVGDRAFRVTGEGVERLMARHDLDNDEALAHIEGRLRRIGVLRALEEHGFQPGD